MRQPILILGHNYATQFIDIYNQYTKLFNPEQFDVTVAYLTGEPDEAVKRRTLAQNVLFLNTPKTGTRGLKMAVVKQLLALCREKQFQIVICHRYKPTYIMMWIAQFLPISALIFVMHELGTMTSLRRQLLIAVLRRKNMLFAGVSNAVRDDLRDTLWCVPNDRIATLYNMIDIELTEPQLLSRTEARKALNLPDEAFVFGNLARLAPNKNQTSLIQAFACVKKSYPLAKLIILGEGELGDSLKKQAQNSRFGHDIIFSGFVPEGFRYMKAFDCFVLSSTQEAFGRVLLEAMVARLPIIATTVHGIPEVVAHAGTLVPPDKADKLAAAMNDMCALTLTDREKLGAQAYEHARIAFSIPAFQRQFWQLPLLAALKD